MTNRDALIEWAKGEIRALQDQVDIIEAGKARFWSQSPGGAMIETTEADLAENKRKIANLEKIVAG